MKSVKFIISKNWLYEQYWIKDRWVSNIAKELGYSRSTIFRRLKKYNISLKGNSIAHRNKNIGNKSSRWKGGKPKCFDCNKPLKNIYAIRCHRCATIERWKDLEFKQKVLKKTIRKSRKFNKKEQLLFKILNQLFPNTYEYVGNGKLWIENFNPDFIDIQNKQIIELYGDYWHNLPGYKERDMKRLKTYKKYGYNTVIIWGKELKDMNTLKRKIMITVA